MSDHKFPPAAAASDSQQTHTTAPDERDESAAPHLDNSDYHNSNYAADGGRFNKRADDSVPKEGDPDYIPPSEVKAKDMDRMMKVFSTDKPDAQYKTLLANAFEIIVKDRKEKLISAESLQEAAAKLNVPVTKEEIHEWIVAADEDENGEIDFQEFVELMCSPVRRDDMQHELQQTFRVFDKDGSGTISCTELCGIIKEFDQELSEQEARDMVAVADINKSGTIDLDELVEILLSPDEEPNLSA